MKEQHKLLTNTLIVILKTRAISGKIEKVNAFLAEKNISDAYQFGCNYRGDTALNDFARDYRNFIFKGIS